MPIQRSRGGCHNCKRRKRKCDETRPQCRACQSRGDSCGGYNLQLRWHSSKALLGHPSQATDDSVGNASDLSGVSPSESATTASSHSSPGSVIHDTSSASDAEREAFGRFLSSGIHVLYSTTMHEWIKPLFAQYALHSLALLVICANIQIFVEDGRSVRFHRHFERVLTIFRDELFASNGQINPPTLSAGLLMCALCHMQGLQWTNHLQCMFDYYNLRGDLQTLANELTPYTYHCLEVMGVMDLPNTVLGRRNDCIGIWRRLRQAQENGSDGKMSGVEPVSGLPRSLLDLAARMNEPNIDIELWLWQGEVGEFVQCHLWDAWRFAAILDYRRRGTHTAQKPGEPPVNIKLPTSEKLVFRLLSALEAMRVVLKQKENSHLLTGNATHYPWFMASIQVQLLRQNPRWQTALDSFQEMVQLGNNSENIRVLHEIVAKAQSMPDESFDIDELARERSVEIILL